MLWLPTQPHTTPCRSNCSANVPSARSLAQRFRVSGNVTFFFASTGALPHHHLIKERTTYSARPSSMLIGLFVLVLARLSSWACSRRPVLVLIGPSLSSSSSRNHYVLHMSTCTIMTSAIVSLPTNNPHTTHTHKPEHETLVGLPYPITVPPRALCLMNDPVRRTRTGLCLGSHSPCTFAPSGFSPVGLMIISSRWCAVMFHLPRLNLNPCLDSRTSLHP